MIKSQWRGKKVAFLGDSITDKVHVGTTKNYWQFLQEELGIEPLVYGINGWQWSGIPEQALKLLDEHGTAIDAIFVFMGTNDFNGGVPIGEWWILQPENVVSHGIAMTKQRRIYEFDQETFCGRLNIGLKFLKEHFPLQQIVLMTPIHRGFATFGGDNIQPEDSFPNDIGLFMEPYIESIRRAGEIWSVPVIDLYSESGLLPVCNAYASYFHDGKTDRLHPNAAGHSRMAQVILYRMLSMPAGFRS